MTEIGGLGTWHFLLGRCWHLGLTLGVDTYQSEYHLGRCQHPVSTLDVNTFLKENAEWQPVGTATFNICRCQNFQPARTELFCLGEESKEVTNRSNRACSTRWADLDVLAEEERLAIWISNVFRQTLGTNLMQHRRRINFFEYLFTQLHCQASVNFVHLLVQLGVVPEKSSS